MAQDRTKSQAIEHEKQQQRFLKTAYPPGSVIGGPGSGGWNIRDTTFGGIDSGQGFANDLPEEVLADDIWTIDLATPTAGMMEPGSQIFGGGDLYFAQTPAQSGADAVYPKPQADGSMMETRTYRNESEDSRYTFEVSYKLLT